MTAPRSEKPKPEEKPTFKAEPVKPASNETFDDLISYAKANTKDTIAFVLIIIGAVMMFFDPFWGGLIVGVVAGIYFGDEILALIKGSNDLFESQGHARSFIAAGVLFAILIAAPSLFLGGAIAIAIRHLASDKK